MPEILTRFRNICQVLIADMEGGKKSKQAINVSDLCVFSVSC